MSCFSVFHCGIISLQQVDCPTLSFGLSSCCTLKPLHAPIMTYIINKDQFQKHSRKPKPWHFLHGASHKSLYLLSKQSISQDTSGLQETPASHMFPYFCSLKIWVTLCKRWYSLCCFIFLSKHIKPHWTVCTVIFLAWSLYTIYSVKVKLALNCLSNVFVVQYSRWF